MQDVLSRPPLMLGPGAGLLRHDHFQIAYATNDIEKACDLFRAKFGVKDFRRLDGPTAAGGYVRIELAWVGGVMFELASGHGPGSEIFSSFIPASPFMMRPHHLGYFVPTAEAWDAVLQEIERDGLKIVHRTHVPNFLQAIIVDVPELGHYLEYIFPEAAGKAFFEGAPGS